MNVLLIYLSKTVKLNHISVFTDTTHDTNLNLSVNQCWLLLKYKTNPVV